MRRTVKIATLVTAVCAVGASLVGPGATAAVPLDDYIGDPVAIVPNDPGDDAFGNAIDVDGDTMVVGAVCDLTAGGNCDGSVYVFVRSDGNWVQQRKIIPPDIRQFQEFGRSVAVSGDTIVIGSNDPGGRNAGAAYVYVRSGSTWSRQTTLFHPNGEGRDLFGYHVAIDGDTIVVGAPDDTVKTALRTGTAHVFVRSGSTWSRQVMLRLAAPGEDDRFGRSVAVQGDTVLVGATNVDTKFGESTGAAFVFERTGSTWSRSGRIAVANSREFGYSVALDGDTAIVGNQFDSLSEGDVHVFVRAGTSWTKQAVLTPMDGTEVGGVDLVAIDGDKVVIGSEWESRGGIQTQGAAYVFERSGAAWDAGTRVVYADPHEYDHFGVGVAVQGDRVYISGYTEPQEAVYEYEW